MPPGDAELEFDGKSYPENPTVPPAKATADTSGAISLIGPYGSYVDDKPLRAQ